MVKIDKDILLAYQQNGRELSLRVTINGTDVLTESQITDFSISETLSSDENLSLGNTPCKKLSLNLIEPTLTTGLDKALIKAEIGIKIGNEIKYTNLGYFYESEHKIKNNGAAIAVTAYDGMIKVSDNGNYTCGLTAKAVTAKNVIEDICKQSGVNLTPIKAEADIQSLTTFTKSIPIKYNSDGTRTTEDGYVGIAIVPKFYTNISIYSKEASNFTICYYGDKEGTQLVNYETYEPFEAKDTETGEIYWAVSLDYNLDYTYAFSGFSVKADENCTIVLDTGNVIGQCVNINTTITNPGKTDISTRKMLGLMAGLLGCNARFDRENNLEIVPYKENYSFFNLTQYQADGYEKNVSQELSPRYLVSGSENKVISVGAGDYGYNFANEYINSTSVAQNVLQNGINSTLTTVTGTLNTFFNPTVEMGDVVLIENVNGYYDTFLVTENNITVNGGITSTLANTLSKESSDTHFSSPSTKTLTQVNDVFKKAYESIVGLLNGTRGGYVKFVTDKSNTIRAIAITENDVEIQWDETTNKVVTYNSGVSTNEAMWVWSYAGLAYTPNGGYSYRTAMTMEGDIYSNRLLSPTGLIAGFTLSEGRMISSSSNGLHNGQIRGYDFNSNHNFLQIDYTDSNGNTTQPFVVNYDGTVEMKYGKLGSLSLDSTGIGLANKVLISDDGYVAANQFYVMNNNDNVMKLYIYYDGVDNLIEGVNGARDLLLRTPRNIYLLPKSGDVIINPGGSIRLKRNVFLDFMSADNGDHLIYIDGEIGWTSSSRKYKKNIKDVDKKEIDYEALYNLPIRQFEFKDGIKGSGIDGVQIGFIADEVADVFPNAALRNKDGEPSNWTERTLIPAMLKLIQEQKKTIDDLTSRVEKIEKLLTEKEG
nr:MAG TPA: endosialidase chaperone [Caudoviricetes sp.]